MPRDELEAAYFTLLRARQELDDLRRYDEYLVAEAQRLRRSINEGDALADPVPRKLRRGIDHTAGPLRDAITARLGAIEDERGRLPERVAAAERYVEECEHDHDALKRGG